MVSILIVNWNTRDLLRACLLSLGRTCGDVEHEIIVVDNASQDGSAEMVRREFPDVQLIANAVNEGYAAGNNRAFERSRGDWIWLLNPDTEVFDGALQTMLQWAQTKNSGVASALIDASTRKVQRSCRTFPVPAALWAEALGLARAFPHSRRFGFYKMGWWRYNDARIVQQPMASSWLLKRSDIEQSGGLFDEQFPIFFNDVDLAWRLWNNNVKTWFVPDAKVLHHGGASTRLVRPEMIAESHRSLRRFYHKHFQSRLSPPVFRATIGLIEATGRARVRLAKQRKREPQ